MRRRQWKLLSSWKAVAWLYGTAARQLEALLWRQALASFRAWREHVRLKHATKLEEQVGVSACSPSAACGMPASVGGCALHVCSYAACTATVLFRRHLARYTLIVVP
jgi:hypothetical protein